MKNISRRVFIKGMAVAAVATAASTVLTGCNLPVGPVEPEVVPGFQPESKTLTIEDEKNGDKTLTISTTAFATAKTDFNKSYNDLAVLSLALVNKLKTDFTPGYSYLTVEAFVDERGDKLSLKQNVANVDDNLRNQNVKADTDTVTGTTKGSLYFDIKESQKDWKKITFVFTLNLDGQTEKVEFVVNK